MSDQVDLPILVRQLNQRLSKREKGTLFLRSDDGHAYAVACQGGAITGVWSGATVGNAAVEKLCAIKQASYRFSPAIRTPLGSKPDASYVSRLLGAGGASQSASSEVAPSGREETEFHQQALAAIRSNLLDVLGPFATFLLDDALSSAPHEFITPENLQQFLSTLAAEFEDQNQASKFMQTTSSALNSALIS